MLGLKTFLQNVSSQDKENRKRLTRKTTEFKFFATRRRSRKLNEPSDTLLKNVDRELFPERRFKSVLELTDNKKKYWNYCIDSTGVLKKPKPTIRKVNIPLPKTTSNRISKEFLKKGF
jgi:hypothetical protein